MRTLALAVLLALAAAAPLDGQFRVYPRSGASSGYSSDRQSNTSAAVLPTGDLTVDFDGGYDVSMNVLQLYVTPDIDGWNWYFPLVLTTTPSENTDEKELQALAGGLTGEAEGIFNVSLSWAKEWRQQETVNDEGEMVRAKSQTVG